MKAGLLFLLCCGQNNKNQLVGCHCVRAVRPRMCTPTLWSKLSWPIKVLACCPRLSKRPPCHPPGNLHCHHQQHGFLICIGRPKFALFPFPLCLSSASRILYARTPKRILKHLYPKQRPVPNLQLYCIDLHLQAKMSWIDCCLQYVTLWRFSVWIMISDCIYTSTYREEEL